jgi:hypothetical protein
MFAFILSTFASDNMPNRVAFDGLFSSSSDDDGGCRMPA